MSLETDDSAKKLCGKMLETKIFKSLFNRRFIFVLTGGCVIRMISELLTMDKFRKGLTSYLQKMYVNLSLIHRNSLSSIHSNLLITAKSLVSYAYLNEKMDQYINSQGKFSTLSKYEILSQTFLGVY